MHDHVANWRRIGVSDVLSKHRSSGCPLALAIAALNVV